MLSDVTAARRNPLNSFMRSNRLNVLSAMRRSAGITIADIARETGLSKVTVTKCVEHYLGENLAECVGKEENQEERGKRAALYCFNPRHKVVFCVKIDEVHLLAALTDLDGTIVDSHSVHYTASTPLEFVLESIREAFPMLLARAGKKAEECVAAVVGCHGVIDPELGICFVSPHFSGWGLDIPMRDLVAATLPDGIPVYVNNWIHFHALGELRAMPTPVSRFFLIGSEMEGLAGGLVIDGRMYRGSGSLSGEIAHMIVDTREGAERCACGGGGCFEACVSPRRMESRARGMSFAAIAEAVGRGDPFALSLMDEVLAHWAIGITNIIQICDPELIIIQGEYAKAGPYFLAQLQERLQSVSLVRMRKMVEIAYSDVGDKGTILGAGTFAAEKYLASLA